MSAERVVYSIQKTYIIKSVSKSEKQILTCDERIDIPTIEPLTEMKAVVYQAEFSKIIPCVELAVNFLGEFNDEFEWEFETNEGVTVLPIKIGSGRECTLENPYLHRRYVLVLPRGTTGVKSCNIVYKGKRKEIQHNLTFGVMPPPYNYDNALFGYLSDMVAGYSEVIQILVDTLSYLKLTTTTPTFASIDLPKGAGKQTINIKDGVLFYNTSFSYPLSPNSTTHKPKITLHGDSRDQIYTLSLDRTTNTVSIDLFTGMITAYDMVTGEIIQQFKLPISDSYFKTLSFENFDDIDDSVLRVTAKGARVE